MEAKDIDNKMQCATLNIKSALESDRLELDKIAKYMLMANNCFEQWGLITTPMRKVFKNLGNDSVAAKVTGSGLGGMILSLCNTQ